MSTFWPHSRGDSRNTPCRPILPIFAHSNTEIVVSASQILRGTEILVKLFLSRLIGRRTAHSSARLDYQGVSLNGLGHALLQKNKFVIVFPQYEEVAALETVPAGIEEGIHFYLGQSGRRVACMWGSVSCGTTSRNSFCAVDTDVIYFSALREFIFFLGPQVVVHDPTHKKTQSPTRSRGETRPKAAPPQPDLPSSDPPRPAALPPALSSPLTTGSPIPPTRTPTRRALCTRILSPAR